MIIFGNSHKNKRVGYTYDQYTCGHCNNTNNWSLVRYSSWFTLFFIPIFPYRLKEMFICPICDRGFMANSPDGINMKGNVVYYP